MKKTLNHQEHLRPKTQPATISHRQPSLTATAETLWQLRLPSTVAGNSPKYTKTFLFYPKHKSSLKITKNLFESSRSKIPKTRTTHLGSNFPQIQNPHPLKPKRPQEIRRKRFDSSFKSEKQKVATMAVFGLFFCCIRIRK
ncbi:putative r2r3-myb transcription factor [Corchorus olitorius]|uniref:R2r3-myb transcription factor n=1 Tax=Corchorus olitorius TaxID=93759 RepID=A0A1R3KF10_9ROSI|nr:putative r2r3-myb transcription factor [Corchorus olitorius]